MTAINPVTDLSMDGDVAVITLNSPPVNALSANVREGLFEGFKAATADPAAKAIVLICEGRTFIAGADITEFGGASRGQIAQLRLGRLAHIDAHRSASSSARTAHCANRSPGSRSLMKLRTTRSM